MKKFILVLMAGALLTACKKEKDNGKFGNTVWTGSYEHIAYGTEPFALYFTSDSTIKLYDFGGEQDATCYYDPETKRIAIESQGSFPSFRATVSDDNTLEDISNNNQFSELIRCALNTSVDQKLKGSEFWGNWFITGGGQISFAIKFKDENNAEVNMNNVGFVATTDFVRKHGTLSFSFNYGGQVKFFFGVIEDAEVFGSHPEGTAYLVK